jgi:hypothetical protein
MKITTADNFWIVLDPAPFSELVDICVQTTLRGLELIMAGYRITGGNMAERNLTIYSDEGPARHDAKARLAAR